MNVPFVDLTITTERIRSQYLKKIDQYLEKKQFILGPDVDAFEKSWAEKIGLVYCSAVSSGADALYLGLKALGIGDGDEVITQGTAYNASVVAIMRTGAKPRFVDIENASYTLDITKVVELITDKTKAIMPVHLYGQSCDMEELMRLANKHNIFVIEDCAQSHNAEFKKRKLGSFGQIAAFSFYPTKNVGAFGDAGAVVTNDKKLNDAVRSMRHLGQTAKDEHIMLGSNMRPDSMQMIAVNLQLPYMEDDMQKRQRAANTYIDLIKKMALPVDIPEATSGSSHAYHLFVIKLPLGSREIVRMSLSEKKIQTAIHYPLPVYHQPFYQGQIDPCPVTEDVLDAILSIPLYIGIKPEMQQYVIESLQESLL